MLIVLYSAFFGEGTYTRLFLKVKKFAMRSIISKILIILYAL